MRSGCKSGLGLSRTEVNKTLVRRFKSKLGVPDARGCIAWLGSRTSKGYGVLHFSADFRKTTAHRIAWVIAYGDLEPEKLVLHRCDNPSCVNPEHLFVGSPQENTDDMVGKKRHAWLNGQPWQKLNADDVIQIRALRSAGHTQQFVADKFRVSRPLISMIENGYIQHAQSAVSL